MITEDFYPWLIEINASPDLAPSTSVTARLCPQAVEDVIKVVVDRKIDQVAETGCFEQIFKQVRRIAFLHFVKLKEFLLQ